MREEGWRLRMGCEGRGRGRLYEMPGERVDMLGERVDMLDAWAEGDKGGGREAVGGGTGSR